MSFIETTAPEQANNCVAVLYKRLQGRSDYLPNYARVFCHRPDLMSHIAGLMEHLREPMGSRLWGLVNLSAALASNSSYCSLAMSRRLIGKHFSESELLLVVSGEAAAPLSAAERQAMQYAALVAGTASAVEQEDIDALYHCGFSAAEIFDIAAAAAWRCFFSRIPDALGALPDRAMGDMDEELLSRLLVGRPLETGDEMPARVCDNAGITPGPGQQ